MPIQQFRVTLAPGATIDVCGDYAPHQALLAAQCALNLFGREHAPAVLLCVPSADGNTWERFDDVTPPDALIGHAVLALADEFPALGLSFGYIGNVDRFGDDRGWRVFSNQRTSCGRSHCFGDYSTDRLGDMLEAVKAGRVRTWCESLTRGLA